MIRRIRYNDLDKMRFNAFYLLLATVFRQFSDTLLKRSSGKNRLTLFYKIHIQFSFAFC